VEGAEDEVLSSFPFASHTISVLSIEGLTFPTPFKKEFFFGIKPGFLWQKNCSIDLSISKSYSLCG